MIKRDEKYYAHVGVVRKIDPALWHDIRLLALAGRRTVAQEIELALKAWMESHKIIVQEK